MNSPENNPTDLNQQNKESMDALSEQQDDRWTGPHIGPAPEPQPIPAATGEAPIALLGEQQSETPRNDQ